LNAQNSGAFSSGGVWADLDHLVAAFRLFINIAADKPWLLPTQGLTFYPNEELTDYDISRIMGQTAQLTLGSSISQADVAAAIEGIQYTPSSGPPTRSVWEDIVRILTLIPLP
jgi:hypothetical protein